jgi:hypothetical protein
MTTSGSLTEFIVPSAAPPLSNLPATSDPFGITVGSDGALWFVERSLNQIGRITTDGFFTEYQIPTPLSGATEIAAGADGALWFTEVDAGVIGRITTAGVITEFPLPGAGPDSFIWPTGIARGPDNAMWFTERLTDKIGRITTDGVLTEFPVTADSEPFGITAGPDGAMWFTENRASHIGRIQVQHALSAPTNLKTTQLGFDGNRILLTWDYGNDPVDSFIIQSQKPSSGAGNWPVSVTVPASVCSQLAAQPTLTCFYVDNTVVPFSTQTYRVNANQGAASSTFSNTAPSFQIAIQTQFCEPATDSGPLVCPGPVTQWPSGQGNDTRILAEFTPEETRSVDLVARDFGYNHFNWIQTVTYLPPNTCSFSDRNQNPLSAPFLDPPNNPPIGGYTYLLADLWPYYWDEVQQQDVPEFRFQPNEIFDGGTRFEFWDRPQCPSLGQADYIQFIASLVGVNGPLGTTSNSTLLASFIWNTNNTLGTIGILTPANPPLAAAVAETGTLNGRGIFNVHLVSKDDLPTQARAQLIQAGVQGVPSTPKVDRDAPTTTALLSGSKGLNDWYTSLVNVTLIPTDVDGPSDIASTSYTLDDGPQVTYTGRFLIAGDGIHNLEFGSTDIAGNVEVPRPSRTVKIDSTPPVLSGLPAAGCTLWPPNHKFVTVATIAGSDLLSGLVSLTVNGTSNEPMAPNDPDMIITGSGTQPRTVQLRADRLGNGTARVYTLTITAIDAAGNTVSAISTCTVPHDKGT